MTSPPNGRAMRLASGYGWKTAPDATCLTRAQGCAKLVSMEPLTVRRDDILAGQQARWIGFKVFLGDPDGVAGEARILSVNQVDGMGYGMVVKGSTLCRFQLRPNHTRQGFNYLVDVDFSEAATDSEEVRFPGRSVVRGYVEMKVFDLD